MHWSSGGAGSTFTVWDPHRDRKRVQAGDVSSQLMSAGTDLYRPPRMPKRQIRNMGSTPWTAPKGKNEAASLRGTAVLRLSGWTGVSGAAANWRELRLTRMLPVGVSADRRNQLLRAVRRRLMQWIRPAMIANKELAVTQERRCYRTSAVTVGLFDRGRLPHRFTAPIACHAIG